jgi:actin-related protein
MLVAMVPFLTMAQKRSKKVNKNVETIASYEFMIITGYEIMTDVDKRIKGPNQISTPADQVKKLMQSNTKVIVEFDLGKASNQKQESIELNKQARNFTTIVSAVNAAANRGWEFHSANVIAVGDAKVHYYYMRRNK